MIEIELELVFLLDDLEAELPFEDVAALDRLEHVAPVEIWIFAGDFELRPTEGMHPEVGFQ